METSEKAKTAESESRETTFQQSTEQSTSIITMTQEELDQLLIDKANAVRGEEGKKHKIALTAAENRVRNELHESLARVQEDNQQLQSVLDDMAKDDPDKSRLVELLRQNKKKGDDLGDKIKAYEPKIAKVEEWELTEMCNQVAAEFDSADATRLKRVAARTKFNDTDDRVDQIRELAQDLGWKTKAELQPGEKPRKTDSDISSGKTKLTIEDVRRMSPEERNKRYKEIASIPFS